MGTPVPTIQAPTLRSRTPDGAVVWGVLGEQFRDSGSQGACAQPVGDSGRHRGAQDDVDA